MDLVSAKYQLDQLKSAIEENRIRAVSTLYSKLQSRIFQASELLQNFRETPALLLTWINENYSRVSVDVLTKIVTILLELSKAPRGCELLLGYGAVEFLCEFEYYARSLSGSQALLAQLEKLLQNLAAPGGYSQIYRYTLSANKENSLAESNVIREALRNTADDTQEWQSTNKYTSWQHAPEYSKSGQVAATVLLERPKDGATGEKSEFITTLPQVWLSESDEKLLFDIGVYLKFGDKRVYKQLLQEVLPNVVRDYPIEVLRSKAEIVYELCNNLLSPRFVDSRDTSASQTPLQYQELEYLTLQVLKKIVRRIHKRYRRLELREYQNLNQSKAASDFLRDDHEHIRLSHPSLESVVAATTAASALHSHTLLQVFDTISQTVLAILETVRGSEYAITSPPPTPLKGLACEVFRQVIDFLYFAKNRDFEVTAGCVLKYLNRFAKLFDELAEADIFKREGLALLLLARRLFTVFTESEYEELRYRVPFQAYCARLPHLFKHLFNAKMKCVYSERQCQDLFAYARIFGNEALTREKDLKIIVQSLDVLKKFEQDYPALYEVCFASETEFKEFLDTLDAIALSAPFFTAREEGSSTAAKLSYRLPFLYTDALLYALTDLAGAPPSQRLYNQIRHNVLALLNYAPTAVPVLYQLCDAIQSKETLATRRLLTATNYHLYWRYRVTVYLLQDSEFCHALLEACVLCSGRQQHEEPQQQESIVKETEFRQGADLSHEERESLKNKILGLALDLLYAYALVNHRNLYDTLYAYLPVFSVIATEGALIGCQIAEKGKTLSDFLKSKNQWAWFELLALELFSKEEKARLYACKLLSNESVLASVFEGYHYYYNVSFLSLYSLNSGYSLSEDFLGDFLTRDKKTLAVLPDDVVEGAAVLKIAQEDFTNLFNVAINAHVEVSIKTSALEQLATSQVRGEYNYDVEYRLIRFCLKEFLESHEESFAEEKENSETVGAYRAYYLARLLRVVVSRYAQVSEEVYKVLEEVRVPLLRKILQTLFAKRQTPRALKQQLLRLLQLLLLNRHSTKVLSRLSNRYHFIYRIVHANSTACKTEYSRFWRLYPLYDFEGFYVTRYQAQSEEYGSAYEVAQSLLREAYQYNTLFITPLQLFDNELLYEERVTDIPPSTYEDIFIRALGATSTQNLACYVLQNWLQTLSVEDYSYFTQLRASVTALAEFVSTHLVSQLLETQYPRERLEFVVPLLQLLKTLIWFAEKSGDARLKHQILQRRVVKYGFVDFLVKIFAYFPHNEQLLDLLVRLLSQLALPSANLDLNGLLSLAVERLLVYRPSHDFLNKKKLRTLLNFLAHQSALAGGTLILHEEVASPAATRKASTVGWVAKFAADREVDVRVAAFSVLTQLAASDTQILALYRSVFDAALSTVFAANESYASVTAALRFLAKALETYERTEDVIENFAVAATAASSAGGEGFPTTKRAEILTLLYKRSAVSHLKSLLNRDSAPPLFYATALQLLRQIAALDAKNCLAVISYLEMWEYVAAPLAPSFYADGGGTKYSGEQQYRLVKKLLPVQNTHVLMSVANCAQMLLFACGSEKQVAEYLLNCTDLLKNVLKWLKRSKSLYTDYVFAHSFNAYLFLDECLGALLKLLHACILLAPDLTIFHLNKRLAEKSHKYNSYANFFKSIQQLLLHTQSDAVKLQALYLCAPLLGGWKRGKNLLESARDRVSYNEPIKAEEYDEENDFVGKTLVLQAYQLFRGVYANFVKKTTPFSQFYSYRNYLLVGVAALLASSNEAKKAFVLGGFLHDLIEELYGLIDFFLLEEQNIYATRTVKGDKKRITVPSTQLQQTSLASKTGRFNERPIALTDVHYYLRIFKCLVADPYNDIPFESESFLEKLTQYGNSLFDLLFKLFYLASRNDDFIEDYCKTLINFSSNGELSKFLCYKLLESRVPLLTELTEHLLKFELVSKKYFAWTIKTLSALAQHKELRAFYHRSKLIENCCQKFYALWNKKAAWNTNNFLANYISDLLVSLSFFTDSHQKIVGDKPFFEMLVSIIDENDVQGALCAYILLILTNCAYSNEAKAPYQAHASIPGICMAVTCSAHFDLTLRAYASQMIYNLVYKSNQFIVQFDKDEIRNELSFNQKEIERELDKLSLSAQEGTAHIPLLKLILSNLTRVLSALASNK